MKAYEKLTQFSLEHFCAHPVEENVISFLVVPWQINITQPYK